MAYQQQPAHQSQQQYYPPPDAQRSAPQNQYVQPQANVDQLAGNMSTMAISGPPQTSGGAIATSSAPMYIYAQSQSSAPLAHASLQGYPQPQQQHLPAQQQYQADGRQYYPQQSTQSQTFSALPQYQPSTVAPQQYQNLQQSPNLQQNQNPALQYQAPQYQQQSGQQQTAYQNATFTPPGTVSQPRNPSARRPVPGTQLQSQQPVTGIASQPSQPLLQNGYPSPPETPNSKNVQQQAVQNAHPPPPHNHQATPVIPSTSPSYFTQPASTYPQNGVKTPISAVGSPAPSYQQPQTIHAPQPTHPISNAIASPSLSPPNQIGQQAIVSQPGVQYVQYQNQTAQPVQYTQATNYPHLTQQFPGHQQPQQQQTRSNVTYSQPQPHPSSTQSVNPQMGYAPQPSQPPQYNNYQQQTFPPPPPAPSNSQPRPNPPAGYQSYPPPPNVAHIKAPAPPASAPPKFSAQGSLSNLYTKSKPTADKLGTTLGKGYKRTSKFLTSSKGKKVMAGTAGLLVAGFIGAEAVDMFGGADALAGGGGGEDMLAGGGGADALAGGGDMSGTDLQASQAYNDMAQQGQMNALSLIDDTQYELVPAP